MTARSETEMRAETKNALKSKKEWEGKKRKKMGPDMKKMDERRKKGRKKQVHNLVGVLRRIWKKTSKIVERE